MPPADEIPQQPELSRRIRAARGYAALTQPELAGLLQVSVGYLRQVEAGKQLKPVQARGLIERVAEICELPPNFFTADFAQLEPGYIPAEDKLASLEKTVRDLMAQLEGLAQQAAFQLADGNEKLERFGRIIETSDMGSRLSSLEALLTESIGSLTDTVISELRAQDVGAEDHAPPAGEADHQGGS